MNWGIMFSRYDQSVTKRKVILLVASALLLQSGNLLALTPEEISQARTAQEARIDDLRNQEIKQILLILSRSAPKEKQQDMLLRLSELYTEKYKLAFNKENQIWSKKMDEYLAMPLERQKYSRKPVLDTTVSKQWLNKAISTLDRIPDQKGRYDRLDEVYYFAGFNKWELGRKKEAARDFISIVRNFPQSKFSAEANRYLGDYAFANREFSVAKDYYQKAARVEGNPARARVFYGLAWTQFKLKEYKRAVDTMHDAIEIGRSSAAAETPSLALQRDAAESLALFYSEGGNADNAAEYFSSLLGENDSVPILRKLVSIYQDQGKYARALSVNKQLIAKGGDAAKAGDEQRFDIMVDGLKVANNRGDRSREAALLKSMTAEFVTNAKEPSPDKVEALRKQVRKSALLAHKEGQKSRNSKEAYARAEDMYRLYLTAFASSIKQDDAAEIHSYLADVLTQLGRQKEAAAEYRFILEQSQSESAYKKYQKDSAAGIVFAFDNLFKNKGKALSKADGDQVIGAIDSYVQLYPNDKDTPKYLARAAGILVTSKRMDEARPRLMEIVDKYPRSSEAWDAAATMLKDAEDRKNFEDVESLSKKFLENNTLMAQDKKDEFRKKLESIASRAKFQQIQKADDNKNFDDAARGYEKLASEAKDGEVRSKALNNAAVSYAKAGDRANEIRIYQKILEQNPGNQQAEKSLLGIANEHFLSGRYDAAAEMYELFYKGYEKRIGSLKGESQKNAIEAIRSAALLRTALKQGEEAGEDFRMIVDAANKGLGSAREIAGEFLFDTAKRLRDEGNAAEAIKSFQKYNSVFPDGSHVIGANFETALLYQKLREDDKALTYLRNTASKVKSKGSKATPEELGYAAHARLMLLAPQEETFKNAPLRLPESQLKLDINAKLSALDKLNKSYIEVMDFGDGTWGVEAYRRMALAQRAFAQSLENAPVPAEFSPEDKAKFRAQLKGIAQTVYNKSSETLETALQKGESLSVVGPVMAKVYIMNALAMAKPDRYPLVQTINFSRASDWLMGELVDGGSDLDKKRAILRSKPDDLAAWTAIGNYHMLRGEDKLAEIFYLHAISLNPKYVAALNNLAYIRGKDGDLIRAMGNFKAAQNLDEFAVQVKKNMARIQMASGLWRHASLSYRQLEVRLPNDKEVKRGLSLAYLATGRVSQVDSSLITSGDGDNGKFAEAVYVLAKGDRNKSAKIFDDLSGNNEYAALITEIWNTKEKN